MHVGWDKNIEPTHFCQESLSKVLLYSLLRKEKRPYTPFLQVYTVLENTFAWGFPRICVVPGNLHPK